MLTITLTDALLAVLIIAAIVVLIKLAVLIHNLIPSAKSMAKIMEAAAVITETAKAGTLEAEKFVSDISSSMSDVCGILNGNKGKVSAATNVINALAGLTRLAKDRQNK